MGELLQNHFEGNQAVPVNAGMGGAVYLLNASVQLSNNILQDNVANQGAGIHVDTGCDASTLVNNTLVNHRAGQSGGSLELSSMPVLENNLVTFASNGVGIAFGSSLSDGTRVRYNDVYGNAGGESNRPELLDDSTNLALDPLYTNRNAGDLTLSLESPAMDAGNPAPAYNDVDGSRCDMGAFGGPLGNLE